MSATGMSSTTTAANVLAVSDEELVRAQVIKFFETPEHVDTIAPIINQTSPLSLRLLDHFVVRYCQAKPVVYTVDGKQFDVYASYKNMLSTHRKRLFDPFRRYAKYTLTYGKGKLETAICQLSFFKWCIVNKVLDYVDKNMAAIREDMNASQAATHEDKQKNKKKRSRHRNVLQVTATRAPSNGKDVRFIVTFD